MIKTTGEPNWRRSRRCSSGACVEVARDGELILMRDSKDPEAASLAFDRATWEDFLAGVKSDEFTNA